MACAGLTTLALTALRAGAAPTASPPGLESCVSITADAERLACYDRLAGRDAAGAPSPATKAAASTAPAAAAASTPAKAPAVATAPPAATAPATAAIASAPAAAAAASSSAAPGAVAAPATAQSFGNYAAEHPKAPSAGTNSIEARVTGIGSSASGHTTVALEGGALWELDQPDPLLRVGDTVTITRATLGSYLMRTAGKREHRVRRLR